MSKYKLGVIGAGNMAEALMRGVISANLIDHNSVVVSDPQFSRRQHFTRELGITTETDNSIPAQCPRIILAVKPQIMGEVLEGVAEAVNPDATIVSIAAGIRAQFIFERLGEKGRIVRVMPNTPMLVSAGMSAVAAGPDATEADLAWTEKLFASCGKTVRVAEELIDAVIAVSGSGPAYFFYLIEAMIAAGVEEGLDRELATSLAIQTCRGAGELLTRTGEPPEVLRARVTSPGGTTQAAIESMESAGVRDALVAAFGRAAQRSRELGKS
jgi:pyrroline-5-carboxylate reductase